MNGQQGQPFPFMMPFLQPSPIASRGALNQVPARVQAAMSYLNDLTFKQMARAAGNEISIEIIEGQKLTDAERIAQSLACEMLGDYFRGTMDTNAWEDRLLAAGPQYPPNEKGIVIHCVNCREGQPNPRCVFCRGMGSLLVFPTGTETGE